MARSPASVETSSLNVTCSWPPADASQVRAGSADDDGEGDGPPAPPADARADGVAADVRVAAGWARAGVVLADPVPAVAREGGAGVRATLAWVTPHPEMTATAATVTTANLSLMADPFAKGSASFRTVAPRMSVQLRTGSATQRGLPGHGRGDGGRVLLGEGGQRVMVHRSPQLAGDRGVQALGVAGGLDRGGDERRRSGAQAAQLGGQLLDLGVAEGAVH